jgi:hypothetical protein
MKTIFSPFFILAIVISVRADDTNQVFLSSNAVHEPYSVTGHLQNASPNPKLMDFLDKATQEERFQDFPLTVPGKVDSLLLQRLYWGYVVQIHGDAIKFDQKNPGVLQGINLQAWLLRTNSTCVAMLKKPRVYRLPAPFSAIPPPGMPTQQYKDVMQFEFVKVPMQDLSGLVISVDGKLFSYEILDKNWQQ